MLHLPHNITPRDHDGRVQIESAKCQKRTTGNCVIDGGWLVGWSKGSFSHIYSGYTGSQIKNLSDKPANSFN